MKILNVLIIWVICFILLAYGESKPNKEKEEISLMDILYGILNDPEFMSLGKKQQLSILITIYNMVENHFKKNLVNVYSNAYS